MKKVVESFSREDTFSLAKTLGENAKPGEVYCLSGDLGAGLGINEPMSSPTFTILQEYTEGRLPLYHYDVYRVGDVDEMEETGFYEYVGGDGVALIEWAELVEEIIPPNAIHVLIEKDVEKGFDYRMITLEDNA